MKLVSALVGLAALGGVAFFSAAASAMPIDVLVSPTGIRCSRPVTSATNGAIAGTAIRWRLLPPVLLGWLRLAPSLGRYGGWHRPGVMAAAMAGITGVSGNH